MSKIKLVIEIDEETIEYSKRCTDINYRFTDTLLDQHRYERNMAQAIANGTPITEGDMISREGMKNMVDGWLNMDKYYHPYSKGKTIPTDEVYDLIDNAPIVGGNQKGKWFEHIDKGLLKARHGNYVLYKVDFLLDNLAREVNIMESVRQMRGDENGKS